MSRAPDPPCPALGRRRVLRGAIGLAAAGLWARLGPATLAAETPRPRSRLTAEQAIQQLMAGNARFVANTPKMRDVSARRAMLVKSQAPLAAVLGCADWRVPPELAFDHGLGDLFVVRVAGNFVSREILASVEYAVEFLGSPLVMVLGHSGCGAIQAAITMVRDGAQLPGALPELIDNVKAAVVAAEQRPGKSLLETAIVENVRLNVEELKAAQPIVARHVAGGEVKVVGAVYDLATGRVGLVA
jgi:carbonic anhydrase